MASGSNHIKNIVVGAVLGVTSMLPGISGATMAVVFGIYERLIRDLADLRHWLKKDIGFIMMLAIGAVIGTIVCAKVLNEALSAYPAEALLFFIGLIAGQIPLLYGKIRSESGGHYDGGCIAALVAGLAIMALMIALGALGQEGDVPVGHDATGILIMFLVGVVVAISAILPGLSHSTILLVAGLMSAFTAAISDLDVFLLLPLALGVVIGALGFAKVIQKALEGHHLQTMTFIIGLTVGSIAVIACNAFPDIHSIMDIAVGAVCLIIGLAISLLSMRYENRQKE